MRMFERRDVVLRKQIVKVLHYECGRKVDLMDIGPDAKAMDIRDLPY